MADVVTGIVTKKRTGRKRIVHDFVTGIFSRRSGFRTDCGADKDSVLPVERFVNQRNAGRTTPAENYGVDRYSGRIFPIRINGRTLSSRNAESNGVNNWLGTFIKYARRINCSTAGNICRNRLIKGRLLNDEGLNKLESLLTTGGHNCEIPCTTCKSLSEATEMGY